MGSLPAGGELVRLVEPRRSHCSVVDERDAVRELRACVRLRLSCLAGRLDRRRGQPEYLDRDLPAPGHDLLQEQHPNLGGHMRLLRQMKNDERGFALVLALGITIVLSMTVVTVIEATTADSRTAVQSRNRVSAFTLAEAGVNNATSILSNVVNDYDVHVLHPQAPNQPSDCAAPPPNPSTAPSLGNTCSPYVFNFDGGTATMSGYFDAGTTNWYVTSVGQVRNPYGGQQTTRTLTATIHIRPQASQANVVPAWNYVFVKDTTPNICNVTLDQTTALSASLYTEGNVCFKNQGDITETNSSDPVFLEARNMLVWLSGSSRGVGDAGQNPTQKVSSAKIANGCTTGSVDASGNLTAAAPHACTTANPYKDYFYVKTSADCTGCGYTSSAPQISSP